MKQLCAECGREFALRPFSQAQWCEVCKDIGWQGTKVDTARKKGINASKKRHYAIALKSFR